MAGKSFRARTVLALRAAELRAEVFPRHRVQTSLKKSCYYPPCKYNKKSELNSSQRSFTQIAHIWPQIICKNLLKSAKICVK